ncbi:MAG TPA: hypothetical protein VKM72_34475 [Thermoanaerobaculia bacterium]|nr:hypothetical protein [Thermoanaerobaculia bacterium]
MKRTFRAAMSALLALCASSGAALVAQELPFIQEMAAPLPTAEPAGPVERYFLLLFDTPLGGVRQMDELSLAVEDWIGHELRRTDAAAVVSYYGQELLLAQDFTRDRQALIGAVGAAVRGQAHTGRAVEEGCPSLLGQDLSRHAGTFYGALQVLAETVDSVPGPKGLLVFSKGFGRPRLSGGFSEILAGPELGIPVQALAENPVLEKYLPEQSLYEPTLEALVSRQIHLYPIDLATDYRETFPLAGVMSRLAAETDGRYVYPVTELPRLLEQIAQADVPVAEPRDQLVDQQHAMPSLTVGVQAVQAE